jgi:hypothetical protein
MNRWWVQLAVGIGIGLYGVAAATGDELSQLRTQIETLQKEIGSIKNKMRESETPGAYKAFSFGGKLRLNMIFPQQDPAIQEPKEHCRIEKLILEPAVRLSDEIRSLASIELEQNEAELTILVVEFHNRTENSRFRFGLDERFIKPRRATEHFPLANTAFSRDEEMGIFYAGDFRSWYVRASLCQGLELNLKQAGEDESCRLLHDHSKTNNYSGIREYGLGLGTRHNFGTVACVDILAFGYLNTLSANDIVTLKTELPGYVSDDIVQSRAGLIMDTAWKHLHMYGQLIYARDGQVNRNAWYIQPSYTFTLPFDWKYCRKNEFLSRYGRYTIDTTRVFVNTATWNRDELSFAMLTTIMENLVLKNEYTFYGEETGGNSVSNDEFVMQMELKF